MQINDVISKIKINDNTAQRLKIVEQKYTNLVNFLNENDDDFVKSFLNNIIDYETNISYRINDGFSLNESYKLDLSEGHTCIERAIKELELNDNLLNKELIKKAHYMMTKMQCFECNSGMFRSSNVEIGVPNEKPVHVPPEYSEVEEYIEDLIEYFNGSDMDHPFIKSSIIHYFLIYIHPFKNGNGRIAALLQHLYLANFQIKKEILTINKPIILMSDAFEFEKHMYTGIENKIHKDLYDNNLWNEWFLFHLKIIETHLNRIIYNYDESYSKYMRYKNDQYGKSKTITL